MNKISLFFISTLIFASTLHAQKSAIRTTFFQNGILHKDQNIFSETIGEFKENDVCTILEYVGKDVYKIKYKGITGFAAFDDLEVTEAMMDLYYDFQERERIKAIEDRKNREKELEEASKEQEYLETKRKDSIAKVQEEKRLAIMEQTRKDSIAKVEEIKRLELTAQRKKDSMAKIEELERLKIVEQKRLDSIAKVKEEQRLAFLEKQRKDSIAKIQEEKPLALIAQKKIDSMAKIEELERLKVVEQKRLDSIAKVKEEQRLAVLAKKRNDSINQVQKDGQLALIAQKEKDSISKIRELERLKLIELKRKNDSIASAIEKERRELLEIRRRKDSIAKAVLLEKQELTQTLKKDSIYKASTAFKNAINDSIAKAKEAQAKRNEQLERMKFRDTCLYLINEYDKFYNITTIRTEPITLGKNLTVELYKQGHKMDVFFNLSENLGCASYLPNQRSSVHVKLENNQTVSFYHSWDIECGEFLFKAKLTSGNIVMLKKSPIKSIVLRGTESSKEITNIEYKEFFIDKLKCIE